MKKGSKVTAVVVTLFLSLVFSANLLWSSEKAHQATEHHSAQPTASPDDILKKLMTANQHYVSGKMTARDLPARRGELLKGQQPSAVVLSCSDSRVPPELIFDQGLGDLFVVRVAGNVADAVD